MQEDLVAIIRCDETKTFVCVKELDLAGGHFYLVYSSVPRFWARG
jgi:hypothetical protein